MCRVSYLSKTTIKNALLRVITDKIALKKHFLDICTCSLCAWGLEMNSIGLAATFTVDCICFQVKRVNNRIATRKQRLIYLSWPTLLDFSLTNTQAPLAKTLTKKL